MDAGEADDVAAGTALTSPVIETLKRRSSVRAFLDKEVLEAMLDAVLAAARQAPTSSNLQVYSFVVVRDPATKRRLAELAGGQDHVARAPVFVAICADIHRLDAVMAEAGGSLARDHLELSVVSIVDAALVGMAASLAGDSLGLGGCMIGGMRNDPEAVAQVLGLPDGVFVVFGMTLGWPAERPPAKPRLPDDAVIHRERYGAVDAAAAADIAGRYDALLEAHKRATEREDGVAWSRRMAAGFSEPKRPELLSALKTLGFRFD